MIKKFSSAMSIDPGLGGADVAGSVLSVGRCALMTESVHENTWNSYAGDFKHRARWRWTRANRTSGLTL